MKGLTPRFVGRYAVDKMFKNKMVIIPGTTLKLGKFFMRFVPERFLLSFIYNYQKNKTK